MFAKSPTAITSPTRKQADKPKVDSKDLSFLEYCTENHIPFNDLDALLFKLQSSRDSFELFSLYLNHYSLYNKDQEIGAAK